MPDHFYVYPSYLDKALSRREGRRVPASEASGEVTVDGIVAAARAVGFTAEAEPAKQYPREAHKFAGRVKLQKRAEITKTEALRRIAVQLKASGAGGP